MWGDPSTCVKPQLRLGWPNHLQHRHCQSWSWRQSLHLHERINASDCRHPTATSRPGRRLWRWSLAECWSQGRVRRRRSTVLFWQIGKRRAGSITELKVNGRGGVAADADAVVLNVTVTDPERAGYLTVYPCGATRPLASNLNYDSVGQTISNTVIVKVGVGGKVCIFTSGSTHLIADTNGYVPAGSSFCGVGVWPSAGVKGGCGVDDRRFVLANWKTAGRLNH